MALIRKMIWFAVVVAAAVMTQGCGTMLQPVATSGAVIYTQGARQHTAMLQIGLPPSEVYAGLQRVIADYPEFTVVDRNDNNFYVEILSNERSLSAQATSLSDGKTLLFLWADAGNSGKSGQDLARDAIAKICAELATECVVRQN